MFGVSADEKYEAVTAKLIKCGKIYKRNWKWISSPLATEISIWHYTAITV